MPTLATSAPLPDAEELRQAALFASGVLMMRGNQRLRAIVGRVAEAFDVPMAAVSIIDRDRQWFPAIHGANDLEETSRDVAFCAHTILKPGEMMVVLDASHDSRFAENPLVVEDPFVRFYAGVPLVTREGAALGALCAIDDKPRTALSENHATLLRELAGEAMLEIEQIEHVRTASPDAIANIVEQIRDAAEAEDESLLISLDRILQRVERAARDT